MAQIADAAQVADKTENCRLSWVVQRSLRSVARTNREQPTVKAGAGLEDPAGFSRRGIVLRLGAKLRVSACSEAVKANAFESLWTGRDMLAQLHACQQ